MPSESEWLKIIKLEEDDTLNTTETHGVGDALLEYITLLLQYGDDEPIDSVQSKAREVNTRSRLTPKETESGSCRVNVAVCLAEPEERTLHQLQLRPKGLMGKTTQQGSRVRRPLSARANWSLRPELTPTFLWRNTYTCMELL